MSRLKNPPKLSLPQNDDREGPRARDLEKARDSYRYTYDKPNIRGLAMLEKLPLAELPSPEWAAEAAAAGVSISLNSAKIKGDAERSDPSHPDHKGLLGRLLGAGENFVGDLFDHVSGKEEEVDTHSAKQVAQFADLYQEWRVPDVASECFLDDTFARARVAGSNPAWTRQVDPSTGIPDDFGVSEAHYAAAIGGDDTLEAALKEGRLFLAEYRELVDATPGSFPVPPGIDIDYDTDPRGWDAAYKAREASYATTGQPKTPAAPLALFAVHGPNKVLSPVAIQLFPNGTHGGAHRVFTPSDGMNWVEARTAVQCADFNVHEVVSHLGLTHLVQEAFALAMHNCLASRHPLYRLLHPHFEGTFFINTSADKSLVSPGGGVDTILNSTIGSGVAITGKAVQGYDFNASILANDLARRGMADADLLPDYPYRDDALLVWGAMHDWVTAYVHTFYGSDADVVADTELQAFVRQVGQFKVDDGSGNLVGGGIGGVGEAGGGVSTRSYLTTMLTQIMWNGSGQHAAVNFPQRDLMSYPPNMAGALVGPIAQGAGGDPRNLLAMLPGHSLAREQLGLTVLLGMVHHTNLGAYGAGAFPPQVSDHLNAYQAALGTVESTIKARNQTRPSYSYLLPSLIPQSINI